MMPAPGPAVPMGAAGCCAGCAGCGYPGNYNVGFIPPTMEVPLIYTGSDKPKAKAKPKSKFKQLMHDTRDLFSGDLI